MNICLNRFGISDLDSFINIHGSASEKERQAFFVRGTGCTDSLCSKIAAIDARLSSDVSYVYRRITDFSPLRDSSTAEYYIGVYGDIAADMGEQCLKGISDRQINCDFRAACRKVCGEVRNSRENFSPTMEKNLGAVLIYWADMYLTDFLQNSGKIRKLICSGRIGCNEYAFCYLAALMGIDVCILLPDGDIKIGSELLSRSSAFVIGAPKSIAIPEFSAASVGNAPEHRTKVDLTRPARQARPQRSRVSASPTAANTAAGSSSGNRYTVDLTRPPKQRSAPTAQTTNRPSGQTPPQTSAKRELSYEELAALAESVVLIEVHNRFGMAVSSGSGIVINDRGYILTNCHVANGGVSYSVRVENDNNSYPAYNVIKYHPLLDLAVIRIDKHIKPLPMYSGSAPLSRGQRVVAIGSPMGLFNSVSDGIIAGFRTVNDVEMIQFTAPISPGSSGGAVLNMYGEVIGISTAGVRGGQNLNLAVGYQDIAPFISNFV
ncbi:MAG: trypsin-like peptidase domain-containing protein [Oscillospiraceae bacterium]